MRERLLELILNPSLDLARCWGGADEAPLLLAALDLRPVGEPVERVELAGVIDNGVRAILPSLQAVADLALGVRLDGAPGATAFQAVGVSAALEETGEMIITVTTSAAVDAATLTAPSVRVLYWDPAGPGWKEPTVASRAVTPTGIVIAVAGAWVPATRFQVLLSGTGDHALLDIQGRLLAGVVGDSVPTAGGRDACLSSVYQVTA